MQIVRFVLVGILNTLVGFGCIFAAMFLLGVDYRIANAIGYTVGCGFAFLANRAWTFRHKGSWSRSLARWLTVVAAAYLSNLTTVIALYQGANADAYIAQLGGAIVYTCVAFLGSRYFAFTARGALARDLHD